MPNHSKHNSWLHSRYYSIVYKKYEAERKSFIVNLLELLAIQDSSKILQASCGNGEFAQSFTKNNSEVIGTEYNEQAIQEAKTRETENLHFYQHDMRMLFWINYFDYAFNLFSSLAFHHTKRDFENEIRSISQSLKLSGKLIIDVTNVHFEEERITEIEEYEIEGHHVKVEKKHDKNNFYKDITIVKDNQPMYFTEKIIKLSLADFTEALSYNGIQIKEVYGDYNFAPYDVNQSPRLIIFSEKIRL